MAGLGFKKRRKGEMDDGAQATPLPYTGGARAEPIPNYEGGARSKGLGFSGVAVSSGGAVPPQRGAPQGKTMEYRNGRDEQVEDDGVYQPEQDGGEAMPMEGGEGGDGLSDAARSFRDEVEADTGDSYSDIEGWKKRWMARAMEMGLSEDEAMRVLDSVGDLDQGEGDDKSYGPDQGRYQNDPKDY